MKLNIKNTINVNGKDWDFGKSILDAVMIDNKVIVIFDYMEYPKGKPAKNLVAFDLNQNQLWVAEHPTNQSNDTYVKITSENPLKANNFSSHSCQIDLETGKLIDAEFYK
jgi:hypothetical protein